MCVCVCVLCWLLYWGTRWHSWLRYCTTSRRLRVRFPMGSFRAHYGPGVDPASNRNEYQGNLLGDKGCRCVGLTTLPSSCADVVEIWTPQPPGAIRVCFTVGYIIQKALIAFSNAVNTWIDGCLSFSFPAVFPCLPFPVSFLFFPYVILSSLCDFNPYPSASLFLFQP